MKIHVYIVDFSGKWDCVSPGSRRLHRLTDLLLPADLLIQTS